MAEDSRPVSSDAAMPAAPALDNKGKGMAANMPQAPAEIGERDPMKPQPTASAIEPDIASSEDDGEAPEPAMAGSSAGIAPDIANDDGDAEDSAGADIEGEGDGESKMAANPAMAPSIAPDIASDDEETAGTAAKMAGKEPKMAPKTAAEGSGATSSSASKTERLEGAARSQPEPKMAAVKPDIAGDDSDDADDGDKAKPEMAKAETGGSIKPGIAGDDAPTQMAAVDPEIAEEIEPSAAPAQAASQPSGPIVVAPVPDPAIIANTPVGPLPVISPDGRQAWQVYARPFRDDPDKTLIAIILRGMGMSQSATNAAIQQLPGEITLSFAAYARGLPQWISGARAAGHEVMLQLPMEPLSYPRQRSRPAHAAYLAVASRKHRSNGMVAEPLCWLCRRHQFHGLEVHHLTRSSAANHDRAQATWAPVPRHRRDSR